MSSSLVTDSHDTKLIYICFVYTYSAFYTQYDQMHIPSAVNLL